MLSPERERLRQVWEKMRKDRDGRRALAKLAQANFDLTRLSVQNDACRHLSWADYIAALPFLSIRATRRQVHPASELRRFRYLIPVLRGLGSRMNDPFCEVVLISEKDLSLSEIRSIPRRLQETADFLEHVFCWDWSMRERNARNTIIAALRSEIRQRTGRPHDTELSALIDAAFRAAGREEGCCIDSTALDRIEKREKEGREKAMRRLRSFRDGRFVFYP